MATGRIGVTPTLRTRWSKAPAGGTTSLSGLDDNSVSLVYDVGYEAVYRNGVLLSRTNDYTATTGNSITLIDATIAGDIIEVFANQLLPLTNAIGNGQYTAKGALLSATAASTPAVLTVGSNDQVLTADSTTATGLKWATPAAGGMTLISTTTLTGTSVTISSIPQTYNHLQLVMRDFFPSTDGAYFRIRINSDSGSTYSMARIMDNTTAVATYAAQDNFELIDGSSGNWNQDKNTHALFNFYDYTQALAQIYDGCMYYPTTSNAANRSVFFNGIYYPGTSAAITSLQIYASSGNMNGTALLYGVK